MNSKKILVFIDYYLPGYKGGGPINTLANMMKILAEEKGMIFYIVTRDRDFGDDISYLEIECNRWVKVDGVNIMYLSPININLKKMYRIIQSEEWSKIYLNSFFSQKFSINIILIKKIFAFEIPILLSPKGEFSPGALKIKSIKKCIYIWMAKLFGLYENVTWHLTDNYELKALEEVFGKVVDYKIAMDPILIDNNQIINSIDKSSGVLRLVFLSRISRKKNLDICLKVLSRLDKWVEFDIYGPIEDESYWIYCKSLITKLPECIKVKYRGEVPHNKVYEVLAKYHILFLPTAGENFGYVIFEALLSGRPVLIGDSTPWKNLVAKNIGADVDPKDIGSFVDVINKFIQLDQSEFNVVSKNCRAYAISVSDMVEQKEVVRNLFV